MWCETFSYFPQSRQLRKKEKIVYPKVRHLTSMEAGQKQSSWHRSDSKMEYDRQKIVSMKNGWLGKKQPFKTTQPIWRVKQYQSNSISEIKLPAWTIFMRKIQSWEHAPWEKVNDKTWHSNSIHPSIEMHCFVKDSIFCFSVKSFSLAPPLSVGTAFHTGC